MDHKDFCVWLWGFCELNGNKLPNESQWILIRQHLSSMFKKVTPELEDIEEQLRKRDNEDITDDEFEMLLDNMEEKAREHLRQPPRLNEVIC